MSKISSKNARINFKKKEAIMPLDSEQYKILKTSNLNNIQLVLTIRDKRNVSKMKRLSI